MQDSPSATVVHLEVGAAETGIRREHRSFPLSIGTLRFSTEEAGRADWLLQAAYVSWPVTTFAPRERRILLITEPSVQVSTDYVNQFGILVSPFPIPGFRGIWHQSHGALTAFFGLRFAGKTWAPVIDHAGLVALAVPEKRDALSVVVSSKSVLPGHRRRLSFVRHLSGVLGSRLELYGRGFKAISDKAEAILPCRYHLVLENTIMPSYWTEKLADAWLGYAFPIVSGPPDLARWFPEESFVQIDIDKPEAATEIILRTMAEGVSPERFAAIREARRRVLTDERLCPLIARVVAAHPNSAPRLAKPAIVTPPPRPSLPARLRREISRIWWQLESRLRA